MPIKDVTPPRGARAKVDDPKDYVSVPFRSDMKQTRTPAGGRGNERVTADDTQRAAHTAVVDPFPKLQAAIDYLHRYVLDCERRARNEAKTLTPTDALKLMDETHKFKERVAEMVKSPIEKVYDILRFTVVPEVFNDNDVTALSLEGIGRCNLIDDISVSVIKEQKEAFQTWLIEHEFEDLISQTVNAQTLAAFLRRQMAAEDGVIPPADMVRITPVTRAQITR